MTIRGATIGCWIATTSPQQRSWDPHTALLIARGLKQHFDLAGTPGVPASPVAARWLRQGTGT